jgi:ribA/ribD-fused uncharacterized protein
MIDLKANKYGIHGFFGPFRFLSNFHFVKVEWQGIVFPTTEHAYQAAKSDDPQIWAFFASLAKPQEARKLGQEIELDPEWHSRIKFEVMYDLTKKKYAKDPLRKMLLDTGDMYLEETNHWGDVCWGVCNGVGENMLGHTLMMVRDEIRNMESR